MFTDAPQFGNEMMGFADRIIGICNLFHLRLKLWRDKTSAVLFKKAFLVRVILKIVCCHLYILLIINALLSDGLLFGGLKPGLFGLINPELSKLKKGSLNSEILSKKFVIYFVYF